MIVGSMEKFHWTNTEKTWNGLTMEAQFCL